MIRQDAHNKILKAVAFIGCFFVCSCHNYYQEVQDLAKKKIPVDRATNVESYLSQDGIVKAKLTAPVMTMIRNNTPNDTPKTEFPKSGKTLKQIVDLQIIAILKPPSSIEDGNF